MTAPVSGVEPSDYIWTNARVLVVSVPVAASAASELLPEGLELADPARATLFVADYPETRFGSIYREAAVLLHAVDDRGPALHCPWMVVDDDTALILGREMLGFPKKMAEIRLEERGDRLVGTASRRGVEVLRLDAELGVVEPDPAPLFGQRMVNAIGTPVTGMKRVDLAPARETIHACRRAECKVALTSSERDPLGEFQAAPSASGRYLTLSFGAAAADAGAATLLGDVGAEWIGRRFFARAL